MRSMRICLIFKSLKLIKYKNYLLKITSKLYGIELQNENTLEWSNHNVSNNAIKVNDDGIRVQVAVAPQVLTLTGLTTV